MDGTVKRTRPQLGGGAPTTREMLDHAALFNGGRTRSRPGTAPIRNHRFRGTAITAYIDNDVILEHLQTMAGQQSPRTPRLHDSPGPWPTQAEVVRQIATSGDTPNLVSQVYFLQRTASRQKDVVLSGRLSSPIREQPLVVGR